MKNTGSVHKYRKFIPAAAVFIAALFVPLIIKNDYFMHLLVTALIYLIAVYGLNFITGMAGEGHLGMAGILCVGAYTSALMTTELGVSAWVALLASIVVGLIFGIVLGYPSLRISGVYLALTTVAFTEVIRLLVNNFRFTGGALGIKAIPDFFLFGIDIASRKEFYYFMLVIVLIFTIITYRIIHSKWGRAFIAVRDNVDAVESCGISLAKVKVTAFCLSSVFGAMAGSIYAQCQNYVSPSSFTMDMSVLFVVMMMFGGQGNIYGLIVGTVVITLLPEALRFLGEYYQLVYSVIVLMFAIFLPGGLYSIVKKFLDKRSAGERLGQPS